jgi:hypothetical protein
VKKREPDRAEILQELEHSIRVHHQETVNKAAVSVLNESLVIVLNIDSGCKEQE